MNRVKAVIAAGASTALAAAAIAATASAQGVFNAGTESNPSGTDSSIPVDAQVVYRDLEPVFVDRTSGQVLGLEAGTPDRQPVAPDRSGPVQLVSARTNGDDSWDDDHGENRGRDDDDDDDDDDHHGRDHEDDDDHD